MATEHEAMWICLFDACSTPWSCLCWQSGANLQFGAPKNTHRPFPKQQAEDTGGFPSSWPALFPPNPSKTLPEGIITVGPFLELSPVALAPVGAGPPEPPPQPCWQNPLNPPRAPTLNLLKMMEQPGTALRPVQSKATSFHGTFARCGSLISPFPHAPSTRDQRIRQGCAAGPIRRSPALATAGLRPGGGCRPFCV